MDRAPCRVERVIDVVVRAHLQALGEAVVLIMADVLPCLFKEVDGVVQPSPVVRMFVYGRVVFEASRPAK